ncbi:hypothetical protein Vadar_025060 [Vaccinium darrowii]|uniref:Uncharacterized protein n=1 Tax=Vaccinium darrowii TaxID=229202 RepID=A0ACB7Y349_9ERIC|nr:hypothetical protein Vadar_025060 [Vaccinium darrowii]
MMLLNGQALGGFGWDEELGTVTAPDEVWEDIIERNPDAAKFRDKGLPHFELLRELYSNSVATRELNRASSRGAPESDDEHDMRMSLSQGQLQGEGAQDQQSNDDRYSIPTAMDLLNEFVNYIPPTIYLKASEMFRMSADVRQIWLCMHPAARMGWLMNLG